ncbi:MAG TPA: carboxypeptidase-like regulatory domain-containing protein [Gemmataceae bacterium]|nr:carboxypeptidase-like regulatory domain-containing protein [Gemmataceae bacterium]
MRLCVFAGLMLGLLTVGGCSSGYKVTGTVIYKGQPVQGATVSLFAENGNVVASGSTDADGKFFMRTSQGKELVPAGTYKAVVSKMESSGATGGTTGPPSSADSGGISKDYVKMMMTETKNRPKSVIPDKFNSAGTTTLKVTVPSSEPVKLDLGS